MATTAEKVRAAREKRRMTKEALAIAADVSPKTIQRVEAGQPHSFESLLAIAGALDIDHQDLIGDKEKAPRPQNRRRPTSVITTGAEFFGALTRKHMCSYKVEETDDEEVAGLVRSFLSQMEWSDIWDEVDPASSYDACREASKTITALKEKDWIVLAQDRPVTVKANGEPVPMTCADIGIFKAETVWKMLQKPEGDHGDRPQ